MRPYAEETDPDALDRLAARVEALTTRCAQTECDVAIAIGAHSPDTRPARGSVTGFVSGDGIGGYGNPIVERVTESVDAALRTAPSGRHLTFDVHFMDEEAIVRYKGYCLEADWRRWDPHGEWVTHTATSQLAHSPACAVTAASLRARAELLRRGEGKDA